MRDESGIDYRHQQKGILHLFFGANEASIPASRANALAQLGIITEPCDLARCVAIEPALGQLPVAPSGALYAPDDESGDAHGFTMALTQALLAKGVTFRYDTPIERLHHEGGRVTGVDVATADGQIERLDANAYVICLGSYSPLLVAPLGEYLPVYPVKGYSVTLPVIDSARCPEVSLTDEARRIVCSRFDNQFRVAGTADRKSVV